MHYDRYCRVGPSPPSSTGHYAHGMFAFTTTPSILSRVSTQPVEGEAGPKPVTERVVQAGTKTDASGKKTPAGHGKLEEAMTEVGAEDMDRHGRARERAASHSSSSSSDDSFDSDSTPATPPDSQKS